MQCLVQLLFLVLYVTQVYGSLRGEVTRGSKYKKVQFLSLNIGTQLQSSGTQTTPEKDFEGRLHVLVHGLKRAYEKSNRDKSVLKVFQLPELFFRFGQDGYDLKFALKKAKARLRSLANDKAYEDFLFVFGTILAKEGKSKCFNLALVMRGGTSGKSWVAQKRFLSREDMVPCSEYTDVADIKDRELKQLAESELISGPFKTDNIHFTLEICRDHIERQSVNYENQHCNKDLFCDSGAKCLTASKTCSSYGKQSACSPQFQLIVSAGAKLRDNAISVVKGGSVFMTDGNAASYVDMFEKQTMSRLPSFKSEAITLQGDNPNLSQKWKEVEGKPDYVSLLATFDFRDRCPTFCDAEKFDKCFNDPMLKRFFEKSLVFSVTGFMSPRDICDVGPSDCYETDTHQRGASLVERTANVPVSNSETWCDPSIKSLFFTRNCDPSHEPMVSVYSAVPVPNAVCRQ